jgi:hypothetical protein
VLGALIPLEPWRENAINWIHNHASSITEPAPSRYHAPRPTTIAQQHALEIIRSLPDGFFALSELAVTHENGIELEWRNDTQELTVEVLQDGSLEILQCENDEIIGEKTLPRPDWRLGSSFDWLAS